MCKQGNVLMSPNGEYIIPIKTSAYSKEYNDIHLTTNLNEAYIFGKQEQLSRYCETYNIYNKFLKSGYIPLKARSEVKVILGEYDVD